MAVARLLDTNAYSDAKRGATRVTELIRSAGEILMSSVVIGELLYGFHRGSRLERNIAELEEFVRRPRVRLLTVSWITADRYGRVAAALRREGTPIPTNDIWIAAHALETGADLLSADPHFGRVDGVVWIPTRATDPRV